MQLVQCPTLTVDNRQYKGRWDGFYVLVHSAITHTEWKPILGSCNIQFPVAGSPFLLHLLENGDVFGQDEYHRISEDIFIIIPTDDKNCAKGGLLKLPSNKLNKIQSNLPGNQETTNGKDFL